ncbi:MAG: hypothetical protein AAGF98_05640 [Cyanobacteria bacterium P01_H01_bin.153]
MARNPLDDSLVLIENQLEGTDHAHLGQIMTYLAGLNTHTVIWIAKDFREPHLSALKWLNDNTVEPFAFFAVKVKAVRIGESPIAPVFEVVMRPNHWERQLQVIAQKTRQMTDLGQFRKAFWTYYVERYPDELKHGAAGGLSYRTRKLVRIDLKVALYLAENIVGVYVQRPTGYSDGQISELLEFCVDQFEKITRLNPDVQNKKYLLITRHQGDTKDRGQWEALADWLHATANTYEAALKEIFAEGS